MAQKPGKAVGERAVAIEDDEGVGHCGTAGWVEHSETHHSRESDGFRSAQPILRATALLRTRLLHSKREEGPMPAPSRRRKRLEGELLALDEGTMLLE